MKQKLCQIFILLFSAFFFTLSSGVIITIHHCCHQHHHDKNDHKHCHEDKLLFKIKDEFTKSEKSHFVLPLVETVEFFSPKINVFQIITPHYQYTIPPLIKLAGVHFVDFTSQRVFYC